MHVRTEGRRVSDGVTVDEETALGRGGPCLQQEVVHGRQGEGDAA